MGTDSRGMGKLLELKKTGNLRYGLLASGFIVYVILFLLLFKSFGTVVGAFTLLPLIIASWLFDVKGGLYSLAIIIPLHGLLYTFFNMPFWRSIASDLPGFVISLVVVLAIGTASRMYSENKRIQAELTEEIEKRKEREMLLREANHRFKNNLSMLAGMMELDLMDTTDEKIKEVLAQCLSRIQSIAQLHDDISWSSNTGKVNLNQTINKLSAYINESFSDNKQIFVVLETEDVFVSVDEASSYSLILNELLTNAYKHAFPDQQHGRILIGLEQENGLIKLTVKDNGKGLPENFDLDEAGGHSLGMMLVKNLSAQLDASLMIKNSNGAEFVVEKTLPDTTNVLSLDSTV